MTAGEEALEQGKQGVWRMCEESVENVLAMVAPCCVWIVDCGSELVFEDGGADVHDGRGGIGWLRWQVAHDCWCLCEREVC